VAGIIANRREVVVLAVVGENTRDRTVIPGLQPVFKISVRRAVCVVVNAGAQMRSRLNQGDFQACLGKHVRGYASAGSTTDDANIEYALRHHDLPCINNIRLLAHERCGPIRDSVARSLRNAHWNSEECLPGDSIESPVLQALSLIVRVLLIFGFAFLITIAVLACPQTESPSDAANTRDRFEHAKQLVTAGEFAPATSELNELLKSAPNSPLLHNLLGYCYVQQGLNDKAVESFRKATALKPDFKAAHNNLGGLFLLQGKPQDAIPEFTVVIRLDPADAQAYYHLGEAQLSAGNAKSGIEHLQRARELAPNDVNAGLALARAYQETQNFEAAIKLLHEIGPQNSAEWHATFGYSSFKSSHPELAIAELQKAMDLDPQKQDYVLELSEVFLTHYNAPASITLLDAAKRAFPNSARIWFALGVSKLLNDNLAEAETALRKSLELDPKLDLAYVVLGQGYMEAGQWNDLLKSAQALVNLNPRNHAGYYYKAVVLLKAPPGDQVQRSEIESLLRRSAALAPDEPAPRYELAKLLLERGDKQGGLAELQAIVQANPDFGQAYYQLYRLYQEKGENEKSRQAKRQYESLRTQRGQAVKKLLVEVRQRGGTP
jgi:predicted Zn-dependent protease